MPPSQPTLKLRHTELGIWFVVVGVLVAAGCTKEQLTVAKYREHLSPYTTSSEACHPILNSDGSSTREWCTWYGSPPGGARPLWNVGNRNFGVRDLSLERVRTTPNDEFSFLAWSCAEPFEVQADTAKALVPARSALSLWTLQARAEGVFGIDTYPTKPHFGLALGDQIYVDPEPTKKAEDGTGIAAFGGHNSDRWLIAQQGRGDFFDTAYLAYLLNTPLTRAFTTMPLVSTWDDHEVRDGWGSHGDESGGDWPLWYEQARRAYIGWQALRAPGATEQIAAERKNAALAHQPIPSLFNVGARARFFVFDTRSARRSNGYEGGQMLGLAQIKKFEEWLTADSCDPDGCLWVVGSSVPLFVAEQFLRRVVSVFRREARDDRHDSWAYAEHAKEKKRVMTALSKRLAEHKNDRLLVLSGDIHESAVLSLTQERRQVGFEIITSGIAAEVHGKNRAFSWRGFTPYKQGKLTAQWAGSIRGGPAFVELKVTAKAHERIGLSVAWLPFTSPYSGFSDTIANHRWFCEPRKFPITHSRCFDESCECSDEILVETLFRPDAAPFVTGEAEGESHLHWSAVAHETAGVDFNLMLPDLEAATLRDRLCAPASLAKSRCDLKDSERH